jgi:thiol-disulfide isomerase/thioredoxin
MRAFCLVVTLWVCPFLRAAQDPQNLSECLKRVQQQDRDQRSAAQSAGHALDAAALARGLTEKTDACVAKFPLASGEELDLVGRLYSTARQPDRAIAVARKAVAALPGNEAAAAPLLSVAIRTLLQAREEGLAEAESLAARLERMSDAVALEKFKGLQNLLAYYSYADMDARILETTDKMIRLAPLCPAGDRAAVENSLVGAYDGQAQVYANRGDAEKALATLRSIPEKLPLAKNADRITAPQIRRYSMIGKPAPPVAAKWWLGTSKEDEKVDFAGRVTILQFTAHWCAPCRKSYPDMLQLFEQYKSKGLQVVFATELYGFFQTRRNISAEDELAEDRAYFTEHHKLPFKVLVEPMRIREAGKPEAGETNNTRYNVGGIPHIVVIDRQGTIRRILVGWDPANAAGLRELLSQLF